MPQTPNFELGRNNYNRTSIKRLVSRAEQESTERDRDITLFMITLSTRPSPNFYPG